MRSYLFLLMSFLAFKSVPRAILYRLPIFNPGHISTSDGCKISTSCPSSLNPFVHRSLVLPEPRCGSRETEAERESIFIQVINYYTNNCPAALDFLLRS